MAVKIKGARFTIMGRFKTLKNPQIKDAITRAGGIITTALSSKTDYLLAGQPRSNKYDQAKLLGTPMLYEEDLVALLAGEVVEVEDVGAAGDRSADDLLGEVRAVMQGPPSIQMWEALVELLDACNAEDVGVLTRYIDDYVSRWGVIREFRSAPKHWVAEMIRGIDAPKYRIVRALDLMSAKITSTAVIEALGHPALEHLTSLVLPWELSPSKSLVKRLCEHPTLTSLRLTKVDKKTGPLFVEFGQETGRVEWLDIAYLAVHDRASFEGDYARFAAARYFDNVRTLRSTAGRPHDRWIIEQIFTHGWLPALQHLHLAPYKLESNLAELLSMPELMQRITHISADELLYSNTTREEWQKIFALELDGELEVLDLSSLFASDDEPELAPLPEWLSHILPTSRLLDSVKVLHLGSWHNEVLVDMLAKTHPNLHVA